MRGIQARSLAFPSTFSGRKNVLIAEKIVSLKQAVARVNNPSGFLPLSDTGNLFDQREQSEHVSF